MAAACYAALMLAILAAMPARAAVTESFPDQPGALSAQEIEAATAAMTSVAGAAPLPLVASGKRAPGHSMPSYALFSGPLETLAGRVAVRRQIICNFLMGAWRCGGVTQEMRMRANGMEHLLYYQVMQGAGNRQAAVDAVDFMYSPCFAAQFAGVGGKPFAPSPDADYVNTILDDGKGLRVGTGPLGEGSSYGLEKTDKAADGCGFRIVNARLSKTGELLPESYAKDQARVMQQAEAQFKREQAERKRQAQLPPAQGPAPKPGITDKLALAAAGLIALLALAAIVGPFLVMALRGVESAARLAVRSTVALAMLAVIVIAAFIGAPPTQENVSILILSLMMSALMIFRPIEVIMFADPVLLIVPAMMLSVVSCIGWTAAVKRRAGS